VGGRVEEAGEQAPLLGAYGAVGQGDGHGCLDDADGQQDGQDAVADPGQVGAVAQVLEGGGYPAGGGAHQELRAGGLDIPDELGSIEAGIGQQEHRAVQHIQQAACVGEFAVALGAERGGQHGTGATLDQDHESQQRVTELHALAHSLEIAPGERLLIGHVQQSAVHGHGPQAPVERTGLPEVGDGPGEDLEQPPQRCCPDPPPSPGQ
jgi:hypothetical protein